jgi:trans-aconitate 2-methyltransferase
MWNPAQYERFRDERKRPFFELLARVDAASASQVVDLGCGTGDLTLVLAERWPEARVTGVDSSEAMIAEATRRQVPDRVRFEQADLAEWAPSAPVDVIVSNAALQWLPDHATLLSRLVARLGPGGVIAFQIPANFDAPSHRRIDEVRAHPRFSTRLADVRRGQAGRLDFYEAHLAGLGFIVDAWDTTYLHMLQGEDAVLQWLLGTTLRPVLAALGPEEGKAFLDMLRPLLHTDYPFHLRGTPYRFTRRFVVASRREAARP